MTEIVAVIFNIVILIVNIVIVNIVIVISRFQRPVKAKSHVPVSPQVQSHNKIDSKS